jgi:hypothetical protein
MSNPESFLPSIHVGDDRSLSLRSQDGELQHIVSPWSDEKNPLKLDRIMSGGWIYCCIYVSSDEKHLDICFVSVDDLSQLISWTVTFSGHYIDQTLFSFDLAHITHLARPTLHHNSHFFLTPVLAPATNDLALYQFYRYVMGSSQDADHFMAGYAPTDEMTELISCQHPRAHLLVIYNHNYARNISTLDKIYSTRFASVLHVLPNIAPPHPRCMSLPFGSYDYHLAVYEGLRKLHCEVGDQSGLVLVLQDDVLLHPAITEKLISEWFENSDNCCAHPSGLRFVNDPQDTWIWNDRVVAACNQPIDHLVGTGFESLPWFFNPASLKRGVSDLFAIDLGMVSQFIDILGYYISRSVFPEVSIPTALKVICSMNAKTCLPLDGIYLWGNDRKLVDDDDWVRNNFLDAPMSFLHPVKISRQSHLLES